MKNVYIYIAIAVVVAGVAGFGGYQSGYSKGYGEAKVDRVLYGRGQSLILCKHPQSVVRD